MTLQRLGSSLVTHKGVTLKEYLDGQEGGYTRFLPIEPYGILSDGSDETSKVQAYLDACAEANVSALIPSYVNPSVLGLVLSSKHNGLHIQCDGWIKFYGDGTTPANKPQHIDSGATYCIYLDSVVGLTGTIKVDGLRSDKSNIEQVHCIGMFGGKDHKVSYKFRNSQGDGIYMNQSKGNISSEPPRNIYIPYLRSDNDDYFGRNALSVISVVGLSIDTFISNKHGGIINNVLQPGSLDIEPNHDYQVCHDITIGSMLVDTCCGGFTCYGKVSSGNYNIRNVSVSQLHVSIEYWSGLDTVINNVQHGAFIVAADGVSIGVAKVRCHRNYASSKIIGIQVDAANNITVNDISTERVFWGAKIGCNTWSAVPNVSKVYNCNITLNSSIFQRMMQVGDVEGARFVANGFIPTTLITNSDVGLVHFTTVSGVQVNVKSVDLSVRCGRGAVINWGVWSAHENIERDTCTIRDSDLTAILHGVSGASRLTGTSKFKKYNIAGVTPKDGADVIAGTGIWGIGDVVNNTSISGASGSFVGKVYTAAGWKNYGSVS